MTAPLARTRLRAEVARLLAQFPGVLLVGPRQVGKTTLARSFLAADHPNDFDLENPVAAAPLGDERDRMACRHQATLRMAA